MRGRERWMDSWREREGEIDRWRGIEGGRMDGYRGSDIWTDGGG